MSILSPLRRSVLGGLMLLSLSGCATVQNEGEMADPLEGVNRAVYGLNEATDILFIGPASTIYREGMPTPIQDIVRNFFRNLELPIIAANKLLQGNWEGAGTAVARFAVNSTVGVAGLADVATQWDLPYQDTDFGVTLASWGMTDPGFYLVLPLLGPSSLRDGIGRGVDWFADPVRIMANNNDLDTAYMATNSLRAVDTRASLDKVFEDTRSNSLDTYATWRSLYNQRRTADIKTQLEVK